MNFNLCFSNPSKLRAVLPLTSSPKCWSRGKYLLLKGEGGILLFSYKVVDFFVDIIYESTLGGYEKVLGISRPEKKKI